MSGPDFRHGYLRVPLAVWRDLYCRTPLTRRQLQLVSVILRESWGWARREGGVAEWTRPLATGEFAARTGLRPDRLRRDLRALVARGLVEERDGRYRLVIDCHPSVRLGITLGIRPFGARPVPSKRREHPSKWHGAPVEMMPSTPGLKIGNINKTKVGAEERTGGPRRRGELARMSPEARLQAILEFFAGPFTPDEKDQLERWVRHAGAAAVWRGLEPALRQEKNRETLHDLLRRHSSKEPEA